MRVFPSGRPSGLVRPILSKGWISEVFVSLQGEGPYIGVRQAFVRLSGCSFGCAYCDTKHAGKRVKKADFAGKKAINPVSVAAVIRAVKAFGPVHSVSITGGEPLEQPEFMLGLLKELKKAGYKTYLETNAAHPAALKQVLKYTNIISADIKLPSATGRKAVWKEHREFLRLSGKKAFVKIVVTGSTAEKELIFALRMLKKVSPGITACIQPDPALGIKGALKKFGPALLKGILKDLRVTPQVHKIAGIK